MVCIPFCVRDILEECCETMGPGMSVPSSPRSQTTLGVRDTESGKRGVGGCTGLSASVLPVESGMEYPYEST